MISPFTVCFYVYADIFRSRSSVFEHPMTLSGISSIFVLKMNLSTSFEFSLHKELFQLYGKGKQPLW